MTVKRRCHGRNKKGRGHVNRVRCVSTGKAIPKDKAIKRFIVRNIVEASALRDIRESSCIEGYQLPKIYIKQFYSIEAAIHQRIVRVRSRELRKSREPPQRNRPAFTPRDGEQARPGGAPKAPSAGPVGA
jgi:small subunit ribosomal protein S26e